MITTPTDTHSRLDRVTYRKRESTSVILKADNMSIREAPDGSLVVELFRYGDNGKPIESYAMHFCMEDRVRLKLKA